MSQTTQSAPATPGTIEHLDPATLVIETNVRSEVALDPEFLDSIRDSGVITPIIATRAADGQVHVRAGQRRTTAAREVGLATVPVYVVDAQGTEADRIIVQLAENEHRIELTQGDRIEAWKQLTFEGLSVAQIAKRTGAKRDQIKTGIAVAKADSGKQLLSEGLTLDQAAILLEFEDDPEAVKQLTEYAITDPGYFPHAVERERRDRADRAECAPLIAEVEKQGVTVLTERPYHGEAPFPIRGLRKADDSAVEVEDVIGKEGVFATVIKYATGPRAEYYVQDPEALGFKLSESYYGISGGAKKGPMTDEQKAERKELIANNKAWDASETVRREWLAQFFARKTMPKNAVAVTAEMLTVSYYAVSDAMRTGSGYAAELLGVKGTSRQALADYLASHPTKDKHVALAIALAAVEKSTDRQTWRSPRTETARYLVALSEWGYSLSPVEKIAAAPALPAETEPETETA
ncbi:ParB/RepB/Spo0J family partition protein [Leucobacter sp. HNU]|uniref:ParB/RepB/Spo0J family partition protein n=1 Tax=Leucobacter sp. HNU TaxID=3236805 RepID=UPI003A810383